jgi:hypothetical protein
MANNFIVLYRGAAATGSTTLYTTPASTVVLVTSIVVTNTSSSEQTYNISLGGVALATAVPVPANDSIILEPKQVLVATNVLAGHASATSVNFHISGMAVTP